MDYVDTVKYLQDRILEDARIVEILEGFIRDKISSFRRGTSDRYRGTGSSHVVEIEEI